MGNKEPPILLWNGRTGLELWLRRWISNGVLAQTEQVKFWEGKDQAIFFFVSTISKKNLAIRKYSVWLSVVHSIHLLPLVKASQNNHSQPSLNGTVPSSRRSLWSRALSDDLLRWPSDLIWINEIRSQVSWRRKTLIFSPTGEENHKEKKIFENRNNTGQSIFNVVT